MKTQIPTEDGIDMQDIRLIAGEGKLTEKTIQQAIEIIRKQRLENVEVVKPEVPGTIKNLTHEELQEYAWWLYKRVGVLERERKFSKVSRVEVIGPEKREYVRYFKDNEYMDWDLQDDDRTLKIFIVNGNDDLYEE